MKQYYTDKKYKELLSHMVVLVDTRENTNKNVTDWFDRNNIKWKSRALKTGDYGLMVESCPEFGCCGKITEFIKWAKDNNKEINWLNIQNRYDLYNEWFYNQNSNG